MLSILAGVNNGDGYGYGHMWGDGVWSSGWGLLVMAAMMIGMVALVAAAVVWVARGNAGSTPVPQHPDPTFEARSILANRLANGDITTEEYQDRMSNLN